MRSITLRLPAVLLALAGTVLGGASAASAAVVPLSPGAPQSVEQAIRAAGPGGTVLLRAGRHPDMSLRGRLDVTLRPHPADRGRVTVQGIDVEHASDLTVRDLRIQGMRIMDSRRVRVIGSEFPGHGIYLRRTVDVSLRRNHVHDGGGIMAQGYGEPRPPGNVRLTIAGNVIERQATDAIAVFWGATDLRIVRNRIAHTIRPRGSKFHHDAIQIMGGRGVVIAGNVLEDNVQGLLVKDLLTEGLVIERNRIERTAGAAMNLFDAPGAVVRRNTLRGNRWGILMGSFLPAGWRADPALVVGNRTDTLQIHRSVPVDARDNAVERRG